MTELTYNFRTILVVAIATTAVAFSTGAANLSDKDKQFPARYNKVSTAGTD